MPTSNWQNISYNIELVRKLNPKTILDVGVGFGRWGFLFREFLEIWDDSNYKGEWNRIIDGVEIFPDYLKDYHKYFYNKIYQGNALKFLRNTDKYYDLINCGDVIEHFEKKEGQELIDLCLERGRYVLINIPIGKNWGQNGTPENPFEAHKSIWYNSDFTKYKNNIIKSFNDLSLRNFSVVLLAVQKIKFPNRYGRHFFIKNILKNKLGLGKLLKNR
jgi:SAM-dependent methyltransferase